MTKKNLALIPLKNHNIITELKSIKNSLAFLLLLVKLTDYRIKDHQIKAADTVYQLLRLYLIISPKDIVHKCSEATVDPTFQNQVVRMLLSGLLLINNSEHLRIKIVTKSLNLNLKISQFIQKTKMISALKSLTKDRQVENNQHIRQVSLIRHKGMTVFCKRRVNGSQSIHSVTLQSLIGRRCRVEIIRILKLRSGKNLIVL